MLRKILDLLRPFLAGCGLFPLDLMLLIDEAGVNFPDDASRITGFGKASSGPSGMLLDPLLLSRDMARCWSFVRCAMRLCIDVILVESRSELRNERALPRLALSAPMS